MKRAMYVSRGLGHTTPIRMNCRPEATVFTVFPD
jgi:predicted MPP superfamily phosphohydrolase